MTARLNRRLKTPDRDDIYFNSFHNGRLWEKIIEQNWGELSAK